MATMYRWTGDCTRPVFPGVPARDLTEVEYRSACTRFTEALVSKLYEAGETKEPPRRRAGAPEQED